MATLTRDEENSIDWALLPAHILDAIIFKLIDFSDFARFASVCKSWFSVAMDNKKKKISPSSSHKQIPMLIIPSHDKNSQERSLYDITKNRYYNFGLNLPYVKRCFGSSHGWLSIVDENSVITLINPFISGANSIRLPPIKEKIDFEEFDIDEYGVHKLVLSANPLERDDYIVAAIPTDHYNLAIIKRGDNDWTYFDEQRGLSDVTYYKGKFYAVNQLGNVMVSLGLNDDGGFLYSPQLINVEQIAYTYFSQFDLESYIVESSSSTRDLLFVKRHMVWKDEDVFTTNDFKVAKLKYTSDDTRPAWIEIDNIGDQALFLGDNHSFSVVASEYPGILQPNSIYYTDNFYLTHYDPRGPCEMGIYNLKNKNFKSHYTLDPSNNKVPPPVWIVPTLQGKLGFSLPSSCED